MTNTTKMTQKAALSYVLENYELPADVHDKLSAMLASVEKKSGAVRKPTPNQRENEGIRAALVELMEPSRLYRASELTKLYNAAHGTGLSSQRISAILRQMKLDGVVTKSEEKRVSYFSLA